MVTGPIFGAGPTPAHQPRARRLLIAAIALKIAFVFVFAWHTQLVMDEFWQLGQSKFLFGETFDTIWPAKAVGYALFYEIAHQLGWNSVSTVLIGRLQTAILGCGTIAMLYACARALGQDRVRALLVLLILLGFSNFEERIFRTRAEPLSLFFATAALLIVLRAGADRPLRLVAAGIASGLAFVATQKGVYFNLALGLGLVVDALAARRLGLTAMRGALLVAGWALVLAGYGLLFGGRDPLPILHNLIFGPASVAIAGGDPYTGLREYVLQTLLRNWVLYLLCLAGMVLAARRFLTITPPQRIALVFAAVITGLVFAHNQPWPYVFIMAIPFLALWAPAALDAPAPGSRSRRWIWFALVAAIAVSFIANIAYLRFGNRGQLDLVARAEAMLAPDERYFDGTGMLPARHESSVLWLDRGFLMRTLAEGRRSDVYRGLDAAPPKLIIASYRIDALRDLIGDLTARRYVRVSPNILLLGTHLERGRTTRFEVVAPGIYGLYAKDGQPLAGQVSVDGKVVTAPVTLAKGAKTIGLVAGGEAALLVPVGDYRGLFSDRPDDADLFTGVYD
ncbi:hypothetical protein B2G71_01090 [Novosphingobium sp. PC22D]|uniref:DUF7055 domain-containing protein n=1 Tax=Novosphingobium sp. PC22D TaxID=1962403 RepID=UPI000BEF9D02|nr:hypothetical protein [Novosphingobium sp. PC22D]PEQ14234.1 hypothetical protein B2G71_01090 [Novosphingobium sp. PC22D]